VKRERALRKHPSRSWPAIGDFLAHNEAKRRAGERAGKSGESRGTQVGTPRAGIPPRSTMETRAAVAPLVPMGPRPWRFRNTSPRRADARGTNWARCGGVLLFALGASVLWSFLAAGLQRGQPLSGLLTFTTQRSNGWAAATNQSKPASLGDPLLSHRDPPNKKDPSPKSAAAARLASQPCLLASDIRDAPVHDCGKEPGRNATNDLTTPRF
jgi:hypothetical protein